MLKVLVTGGAGFIGSHIVDLLIQKGYEVVVVDNLVTGSKSNVNAHAVFYEVDILHPQIDEVIKKEAPEVILHQAALVFVQQSIKDPLADGTVNTIGTLNLLRSAHLNNVGRFIYASTCAVYGDAQGRVATEDDPVSPISFYGASKYMGEMYVRLFYDLYKLDYTILRYANVYGPRQQPHGEGGVIPIFMQNMKKEISPTIFGTGLQSRDFIYVQDVATANLLAIAKGKQQTLNIGTGVATSIYDLHQHINEILGRNLPAQYKPELMGDVKHIALNPERAQKELNWKTGYSLKKGLAETAAVYDSMD
ncbi:NAD-dependent epimerase/dehydratase [Dethiobacter alkaliphilus AHT 1]|uniref:NAD-dependent epimerase/dehydratase n=1 Tax=Dethiobacter alkaliphilus AHT 1 TaxID=555088 RepID=C0GHH8_DETAL|nr:NAD-dependent epimerase/dehydratase [Dethiobacter alkaliphilus AHT 1]